MKTAVAKQTNSTVSFKDSKILTREIRGKKVDKVKKMLENLVNEEHGIDKKFYTKTARKILELVNSAEANAKNKNMNTEKLFVKNARVDKAEKRSLGKTRFRLRGREGKSASIEIVVEER